ncbi:uncharacterized protein MONBRDRAFT_31623 [Monosiga brevicollis MX1]|uniref:1,4-dihydroxy-2-naphthoate octaprenyltransferase n=1 Tax=Monosiga brevicollis TaxID=81824 RepID=A9UUR9_MONBE|nr:uncharacterized protein MONBRDRAFT_31623 [Monosiga brevicollis MX1]EDQ90769.1 predicted protein [Monosiga brevicollis MX1]|eukprot:XP_001744066.1 hypothetical protein [Monosiga brevicollis MX1]
MAPRTRSAAETDVSGKGNSAPHREADKAPTATRSTSAQLLELIKLGRPKFLFYSLACHLVGVLIAAQQGRSIDLASAVALQATIWLTHLMTHYVNDYGDYEADMANENAGSWTGGSKVLRTGTIQRGTALLMGLVLLVGATLAGATCVARYAILREHVSLPDTYDLETVPALLAEILRAAPWPFVAFGLSTFAVAFAYSLPPLRLSANALGEICVSYVLTFVTPVVGCLLQDGQIDHHFLVILVPIFMMNLNRMVIMNIPDRAGDAKAQKITSVVLIGEEKAVHLNNGIYIWIYALLLHQLPLTFAERCAYFAPLPLRFWQSLRINSPAWWHNRALTDSIPFVESLYILCSVSCLCVGLAYDFYFSPLSSPAH